jgi:predicted nucleic acid-binding protein
MDERLMIKWAKAFSEASAMEQQVFAATLGEILLMLRRKGLFSAADQRALVQALQRKSAAVARGLETQDQMAADQIRKEMAGWLDTLEQHIEEW